MSRIDGLAMSWSEWGDHDAVALAGRIRKGEISARSAVHQAAAAVTELDSKLGAILEVFADVLANPDADGPDRTGPLYGVPMVLKDLGSALKGRRQDRGSGLFKGTIAKATDPTIANHLSNGLIPIGRATTPEFGMTFDTTTNYLGAVKVTRSPWNPAYTPGGSSGGSAVAVSSGMLPVGMSSDGGGSTRIPASFCGLIGLKATRGRVPRPFDHSEYQARHSAEGVITRTVRDTAAVYDRLTKVPSGGSFMPLAPPPGSYLDAIQQPPGRLRIGLSTGNWGRTTPTDPAVADRVRQLGRALEALGHDVEEVDDSNICDWGAMWRGYVSSWIMAIEQGLAGAAERGMNVDNVQGQLTPMAFRHLEAARKMDKYDVWRSMSDNNAVARSFGGFMAGRDALLTPTMAIRVPEANGLYSLLRNEELDPWLVRLADACRYTMPGNESGLPAISVPAGLDPDGLPIGAQLYGKFNSEALLLQVAAQLEAAHPDWFSAKPTIHVGAI
jgi:amidase